MLTRPGTSGVNRQVRVCHRIDLRFVKINDCLKDDKRGILNILGKYFYAKCVKLLD